MDDLATVFDLARASATLVTRVERVLGSWHGVGFDDLGLLLELRAAPDRRLPVSELAAAAQLEALREVLGPARARGDGDVTAADPTEVVLAGVRDVAGVVAVTLGGSRATGTARPDSDWDFGLYYRGELDVSAIERLGWPGRVFATGDWGRIVNGGAWLQVDAVQVDLIYRDLDAVEHALTEAEAGRFTIEREVGYVAGIASYVPVGELAVSRVLTGVLPKPGFPERLQVRAPPVWRNLALGALRAATGAAARDDAVGCFANLGQAVLATAQGRLAAAGEWALNEKHVVERSDLGATHAAFVEPGTLVDVVSRVAMILGLDDDDPDEPSPLISRA